MSGATGFTAHNIQLSDGSCTKPDVPLLESELVFQAAKRTLQALFPHGFQGRRLVDIGCLEGGYAVGFARMGFDVVGLEVRESNFQNCMYVKERLDLPNLTFVRDNALNLHQHGRFDVVFCCGLLYHLDQPRAFINMVGGLCDKVALFQTHFSSRDINDSPFRVSEMTTNEGLPGRWFAEPNVAPGPEAEAKKWAAWGNTRSFWIERPYLIQTIQEAGFPLVYEQFDFLDPPLGQSIVSGFYRQRTRGLFVGVKV